MELRLKKIYGPDALPPEKIGYVAVISRYRMKWVIVRLEGTDFWEFPGGTIEEGELPIEAAKRELYEETGTIESSILLLGQYSAELGGIISYGNIYYAEITKTGPLPDFEMEEVKYVDDFPLHSTRYPKIIPDLFLFAKEKIQTGIGMEIKAIEKREIHLIKDLWEKLNEIHVEDSLHFKDHYNNFTFEKRCRSLISKEAADIQIEVLFAADLPVGYCISSVNGNRGVIESLFIERPYRKLGYGDKLVKRGIAWLESINCERIEVSVASGHESVFGFYERLGFYPRMTSLCLKKTGKKVHGI